MASYIVTYDLCGKEKDYTSLINKIKGYTSWAHVTESAWFIKTSESATSIRDNLKKCMDVDDRLFVAELTGTAAWSNVLCKSQYLKENL